MSRSSSCSFEPPMPSLRSSGSRLRWKQNISLFFLPHLIFWSCIQWPSLNFFRHMQIFFWKPFLHTRTDESFFSPKGRQELCRNILVGERKIIQKSYLPEGKKKPTTDHCHGKNLLRQQRKIVYESFKYANLMSSLSLPLCSCISCNEQLMQDACTTQNPKSCSRNISKGNKSTIQICSYIWRANYLFCSYV